MDQVSSMLYEQRLMVAAHKAEVAELVAVLRKVTANLREWIEGAVRYGELVGDDAGQEAMNDSGVLEAEALLKRIDEGTP